MHMQLEDRCWKWRFKSFQKFVPQYLLNI